MLTETQKIEAYVKTNFDGNIFAAYGCSMGGSFVGLLVQREVIHIEHGILGSSDLDQETGVFAKCKAWMVSKFLYSIFQKGKLPGICEKCLEKVGAEQRDYLDKMLQLFGVGDTSMSFVKKVSIQNQFYSDLVTPLQEKIQVSGTTIHIFYAEKMGKEYLGRYEKHFVSPNICRHDMQHEELLASYPEKWAEEVKRVTGRNIL